jgi:hypothetical protein
LINFRFDLVLQVDPADPQFGETMQFVGLRDSIVVRVNPNAKFRIDRVVRIDETIVVSPVLWLVINCQRKEAIRGLCRGLGGNRPEQLASVVYYAVIVSVEGQKTVLAFDGRPCPFTGTPVADQVEPNAIFWRGELEALSIYVYENGGVATPRIRPSVTNSVSVRARVRKPAAAAKRTALAAIHICAAGGAGGSTAIVATLR